MLRLLACVRRPGWLVVCPAHRPAAPPEPHWKTTWDRIGRMGRPCRRDGVGRAGHAKKAPVLADLEDALQALAKRTVRVHGAPNVVNVNNVLVAFAVQGNVAGFREIVDGMQARFGVKPDVVTLNTLLKAHVEGGDLERAMRLLDGMKAEFGLRPDVHSISTVLSGYAAQGNVALVGRLS